MNASGQPELVPEVTGSACAPCLRRGMLVGLLAARLADKLAAGGRNPSAVLALDDEKLVAALAGAGQRHEAERFLAGFDPDRARQRVAAAGVTPVCRHSIAFPTRLLQLGDPPAVLFTRGDTARGTFGALPRPRGRARRKPEGLPARDRDGA